MKINFWLIFLILTLALNYYVFLISERVSGRYVALLACILIISFIYPEIKFMQSKEDGSEEEYKVGDKVKIFESQLMNPIEELNNSGGKNE